MNGCCKVDNDSSGEGSGHPHQHFCFPFLLGAFTLLSLSEDNASIAPETDPTLIVGDGF